uniref:Uncharacterized protein n=1 Tax=Picea glauca TaxID=3330 RepID=A0A124GMS1_PICGL|nr:hypothetical protein ABT39_MTgene1683 [Picea glauca]QHR86862.1 hypothetical protein Q903MT_gene869 [Picea sitchensis]
MIKMHRIPEMSKPLRRGKLVQLIRGPSSVDFGSESTSRIGCHSHCLLYRSTSNGENSPEYLEWSAWIENMTNES